MAGGSEQGPGDPYISPYTPTSDTFYLPDSNGNFNIATPLTNAQVNSVPGLANNLISSAGAGNVDIGGLVQEAQNILQNPVDYIKGQVYIDFDKQVSSHGAGGNYQGSPDLSNQIQFLLSNGVSQSDIQGIQNKANSDYSSAVANGQSGNNGFLGGLASAVLNPTNLASIVANYIAPGSGALIPLVSAVLNGKQNLTQPLENLAINQAITQTGLGQAANNNISSGIQDLTGASPTVAKNIATGVLSTAGGLASGQNLQNALTQGTISGLNSAISGSLKSQPSSTSVTTSDTNPNYIVPPLLQNALASADTGTTTDVGTPTGLPSNNQGWVKISDVSSPSIGADGKPVWSIAGDPNVQGDLGMVTNDPNSLVKLDGTGTPYIPADQSPPNENGLPSNANGDELNSSNGGDNTPSNFSDTTIIPSNSTSATEATTGNLPSTVGGTAGNTPSALGGLPNGTNTGPSTSVGLPGDTSTAPSPSGSSLGSPSGGPSGGPSGSPLGGLPSSIGTIGAIGAIGASSGNLPAATTPPTPVVISTVNNSDGTSTVTYVDGTTNVIQTPSNAITASEAPTNSSGNGGLSVTVPSTKGTSSSNSSPTGALPTAANSTIPTLEAGLTKAMPIALNPYGAVFDKPTVTNNFMASGGLAQHFFEGGEIKMPPSAGIWHGNSKVSLIPPNAHAMLNHGPHFAEGGHVPEFYSEGGMHNRYVQGDGDGTSDDVPAMLANGEFVIPADVVSSLGNGSNDSGAKVLDHFLETIRLHKQAHDPKQLPPDSKGALAYLSESYKKARA